MKYLLLLFFSINGIVLLGQESILIKNVNIWNGIDNDLKKDQMVFVQKNIISQIGKDLEIPDSIPVIDGKGNVLIPGLIDAHVHLAFTFNSSELRNDIDPSYAAITWAKAAENYLSLGFTTVRDLGGPVFGLKKAIDEGLINGPRILPSGAFIGQTSGHGDMRNPNEPHPHWSDAPMNKMDESGWSFIVDGRVEVLKASRENLKKGASQLKVLAGGGISSLFDPLHSVQFTKEEMETAVQAASDWGTYVAVHAYTPESIKRALNAGVLCIDHGQLIDEDVTISLKEKNAWIVPQSYWSLTPDSEVSKNPMHIAEKMRMVYRGIDQTMILAKKHKVNLAFGTDGIGSVNVDAEPLLEFSSRTRWFKPFEILQQATSKNAQLLNLSGPNHPYREGQLGVIETGAYADLLIYEGNPLEDIDVIVNYKKHLKLIMKDGKIIKNEF